MPTCPRCGCSVMDPVYSDGTDSTAVETYQCPKCFYMKVKFPELR